MKSIAILDMMVRDHGRIVGFLQNVEKNLGTDLVTLMKVFDTFEWELEKHIFIEEKAIFSSYNPKSIREGYAMVPELIAQHNELLNELQVLRKALLWRKHYDFQKFKESLIAHKTFEEVSLYPKLDQELEAPQKEEILKKIREFLT